MKIVRATFLSMLAVAGNICWAWDRWDEGTAARKRGDFDTAIEIWTEAIRSGELSEDNLARAYYNRGIVWLNKGQYDNAIADFTKIIEHNQTYALAYLTRGSAWYFKGQYDKAIADYNRTIEITPAHGDGYYSRGLVWFHKGHYDNAIEDYTKAIEFKPRFIQAYYNRCYAFEAQGQLRKAISDILRFIQLVPNDRNGPIRLRELNDKLEESESEKNYRSSVQPIHLPRPIKSITYETQISSGLYLYQA